MKVSMEDYRHLRTKQKDSEKSERLQSLERIENSKRMRMTVKVFCLTAKTVMPRVRKFKSTNNKLNNLNFRMKVIKIVGLSYKSDEVEKNSVIVRKWLIVNQIKDTPIPGKYHRIENVRAVENEYEELIAKADESARNFYKEYLAESWSETFPIMKDVSRVEKMRADDGVEFCILL